MSEWKMDKFEFGDAYNFKGRIRMNLFHKKDDCLATLRFKSNNMSQEVTFTWEEFIGFLDVCATATGNALYITEEDSDNE